MQTAPKRSEVPQRYTWDLTTMYPTNDDWERDYQQVQTLLPGLDAFRGALGRSAGDLLNCLQLRDRIGNLVERLLVYARMRRDEDNTNNYYQGLSDRGMTLYTRAASATSFVVPEILSLPADTLQQFLAELPDLQVYQHYLNDLMRQKAHVRSPEVEELLAEAGEVGRAPNDVFSMLYDADLKFPEVTDEQGNRIELTKGRYLRLIESRNRAVRTEAFRTFYATVEKHKNTLTATYSAQVKANSFFARSRRYGSAVEAALFPDNIPLAVYDNLVQTVGRNLDTLHKYMDLRKRILGVDELHMYDLYVPLVPEVKTEIEYDEACRTVLAAFHPLGEDYVANVRRGLESRWIDVFENEGKTGGAYSWGSYSSQPFVLLNYQSRLDDMFTLAHELGHSLHAHYTRRAQPYVYGHYTTFVAEVASTLNEVLLTDHLLQVTDDKATRMYVLNHYLESFRTTLFRQTMFAEFERESHARAEDGEALTPELLGQLHRGLNERYYGPSVVVDREIDLEWSRIPHFYMNFYVFQYATGLSAAVALAQGIREQGRPAVDRYLHFLSGGSSDYPINLLKAAGVDMASPEPIQRALDVFSRLVDEMAAMVQP